MASFSSCCGFAGSARRSNNSKTTRVLAMLFYKFNTFRPYCPSSFSLSRSCSPPRSPNNPLLLFRKQIHSVRSCDFTFSCMGILNRSFHSNDYGSTVVTSPYGQKSSGGYKKINMFTSMDGGVDELTSIYDSVFVVDNISVAKEVVGMLTNEYRHLVHACHTEVVNIDVKQETPVGHGEVICFSIYSGPHADFGNGKSSIWIDVLDGGGRDLMLEFSPFFEDPSIKKVWRNYSFHNHVIENYGLKLSGFHADTIHMARLWNSARRTQGRYSLEALTGVQHVMSGAKWCHENELMGKISMKTIFGRKKIKKDGTEGKIITIPPVEKLQREERKQWISYTALDAISTLNLYEGLACKLSKMRWELDGKTLQDSSMLDFYVIYWKPFGELLVKMESEGILVDRAYLAEVEKIAKSEQVIAVNRFRNWASKYCSDAKYMNIASDAQLRTLLFGGTVNKKNHDEALPNNKTFKVPDIEHMLDEGKKCPKKFLNITLERMCHIPVAMYTATGWPSVSGDALKVLAGKVSADYEYINDADDLQPNDDFSCNISGRNGRVHCSLNINTETGRLSARRPNLQNQPALEKDRYKIRQAFIAAPGNSLIVADYGQLELRILAHLANCKSMLCAFEAGGDFHSRTTMYMYPHIWEAVDEGKVLLEWHPQPGEEKPPVPLLKDAFSSERRKAKMLNFSIAYGKTPEGLARDWKVSVKEATETVRLWYRDREEVLDWQLYQKQQAKKYHCVRTLLGWVRQFPSIAFATEYQKGYIEQAAINTPVQGSAADVAMCAMLEMSKNASLNELGWRLLLQVHDEVILEGPTKSAEVAKAIVVECMSKPFDGDNILRVDLAVDARCVQNWYSAK